MLEDVLGGFALEPVRNFERRGVGTVVPGFGKWEIGVGEGRGEVGGGGAVEEVERGEEGDEEGEVGCRYDDQEERRCFGGGEDDGPEAFELDEGGGSEVRGTGLTLVQREVGGGIAGEGSEEDLGGRGRRVERSRGGRRGVGDRGGSSRRGEGEVPGDGVSHADVRVASGRCGRREGKGDASAVLLCRREGREEDVGSSHGLRGRVRAGRGNWVKGRTGCLPCEERWRVVKRCGSRARE